MDRKVAREARIEGLVQGVNYRSWTQRRATELDLAGWVRNEPDGTVSALFAGRPEDIRKMEEALWQGPLPAKVTDVTLREAEADPWPESFEVRR